MTIANKLPSGQDLYALRRAMSGLNTQDLVGVSPVMRLILENVDWKDAQKLFAAQEMFGPGVMSATLSIDPHGMPPVPDVLKDKSAYIPPLPQEAVLSNEVLKSGEGVASFYKELVKWLVERSPMTPHHFLEIMAVWVIGLAIARRVNIQFHERIFPHLYVILVAETSKYAKSTGLGAAQMLVAAAMPYMLTPANFTPEAFVEILSGQMPSNYDKLSQRDQERLRKGQEYAAQRGIISDEYSGFLASQKKDYMAGLAELILRLYDARDEEDHYSKSTGQSIIKNPGISILGATTPAALARASSAESWENGMYARFMFMFRDKPLPYTSDFIDPTPPKELVKGLFRLHTALPQMEKDKPYKPIFATMTEEARVSYMAYTKAVFYDMVQDDELDERLHGNYKRLPVQALKIALSLACMDWAQAGAKGQITIHLGHWAIGQTLTETSRASLHRLMPVLNETQDTKTAKNIVSLLKHHREGLTVREISDKIGRKHKDIRETLNVLIEDGSVGVFEHKPIHAGRPTVIYKLTI